MPKGRKVASDTRVAIVAEVCDRLVAGESVAAIFRDPGPNFPNYVTFWRWLRDDPEADKQVADAQLVGCRALEDRIIDVTRECRVGEIVTTGPKGTERKLADMVERSRLEADALKWILARRYPKRYGDRTTIAGDADNPLSIDVTDARDALLRGLTPKPAGNGEGGAG